MHHPDWNMDRWLLHQLDQRRLGLTLHHSFPRLVLYVESLAPEGRHLAYPLFVQKDWNEIRWDQALER